MVEQGPQRQNGKSYLKQHKTRSCGEVWSPKYWYDIAHIWTHDISLLAQFELTIPITKEWVKEIVYFMNLIIIFVWQKFPCHIAEIKVQ